MDTALPARRTGAALVGSRARWARDFTLVGGVTGALAPVLAMVALPFSAGAPLAFALGAGLAGAAVGAVLGATLPTGLAAVRGRVPLGGVLLAMPVVGGGWGALSGMAGATAMNATGGSLLGAGPELVVFLGALCGAVAGAVQLSAFLLPYLVLSTVGRSTWPALALAVVGVPVVGILGALVVFFPNVVFMWGLPAVLFAAAVLAGSEARARRAA